MESSTIKGRAMPVELFERALDCSDRVESVARSIGYPMILLSGGECTDHPQIELLIEKVLARGLLPMILSHGMWLSDPDRRASLLRPEWKNVMFQITYDKRFYPEPAPVRIEDHRIVYIDSLSGMLPLGRFKGDSHREVPTKNAPSSFNLRSLTRSLGDVRVAIGHLRLRAMQGRSGHCSPSISANGAFVAGETNACFQVGTVDSSPEQITEALLSMKGCDRCGLEKMLSGPHRAALGLS